MTREDREIIDEQVEENRGLRADVRLMQEENMKQRQEIDRLKARIEELEEEDRQWEKSSLVQITMENKTLKAKVAKLQKWYDMMFGTPCEEIRHAQQLEALEAELKQSKQRCRFATQTIIESIGSLGPEDLESAIGRIVTQLQQAKAREARLREVDTAYYEVGRLNDALRARLEATVELEERIRLSPDEMTRLVDIAYDHGPAQAIASTCLRFAELCREHLLSTQQALTETTTDWSIVKGERGMEEPS